MKTPKIWLLIVVLGMTGCVSQSQFLDNNQDMALQTAVNRGRFDLNCPAATGLVLSREVVQPALQGPVMGGIQRAEYTVGVSGCGQKGTYVVVCPEGGDGCFAAQSRNP
ncbi:MAG: hypothetical protein V9H25_06370 [Candidatus Competibacter sp.]|jgi:hypothetical protein